MLWLKIRGTEQGHAPDLRQLSPFVHKTRTKGASNLRLVMPAL